jgi:RimJ/RimL family protein N-acetyltransferase
MAEALFDLIDQDRAHLEPFLPWLPLIRTLADEKAYVRKRMRSWRDGAQFNYVISLRDSSEFLGCIDAHNIHWDFRRAEIGYWIARAHEGKGYVTEAVGGLERNLFQAGFHRIMIICDTRNKRSSAIPQRLGYTLEGLFRDHMACNGRLGDFLYFGKLRTDAS